jgi:lipopolysaccharide export system permease protein
VVAALIGFSTLLVGGFSRFGVWRQIVAALLLLVAVKIIEGLVSGPLRSNENLWFLSYVPSLIGLAASAMLLAFAARPRRPISRKSNDHPQSPNKSPKSGAAS